MQGYNIALNTSQVREAIKQSKNNNSQGPDKLNVRHLKHMGPLTKSRQNSLHSVHTRPCRIYEQFGPNNKQQNTTHGNAPKGSGSYLRPKTHIQHTHPQHLSTSTQTSTNHKNTHCNRMG